MTTLFLQPLYKKLIAVMLLVPAFVLQLSAQSKPWQTVTLPTRNEMAANLKNYPLPYAETVTWGLQGPANKESIIIY